MLGLLIANLVISCFLLAAVGAAGVWVGLSARKARTRKANVGKVAAALLAAAQNRNAGCPQPSSQASS